MIILDGKFDQFQRGMNWNLGDLQLIGEPRFGEEWVQQQLDTYFPAMSPNTKKQCQWVASRFEKVTRVTLLPWSHYQTVAGIADPEEGMDIMGQSTVRPADRYARYDRDLHLGLGYEARGGNAPSRGNRPGHLGEKRR